jgi:hypothetical protein
LRKKLAARLAEKQLAEMRNATVMVAFVVLLVLALDLFLFPV